MPFGVYQPLQPVARWRSATDGKEEDAHDEDRKEKGLVACIPKRLREYGPRTFWNQKRRVEDIYGKFWEEDPIYDVYSSQFDREAMWDLMCRIMQDAHLETGGLSVVFDNISIQVPVEVLPEVQTVETSALAPFYGFINWFVERTPSFMKKKKKSLKAVPSDPNLDPEVNDPVNGDLDGSEDGDLEHFKVLDGVSGFVKEGETLLILSPPASGSSSLINLLGLRGKHFKNMTGKVLYNGVDGYDDEANKILKHLVRLVGQDDIHFASFSVHDTLRFASNCMYPDFFPYSGYLRESKVISIARGLGIERVLATPVGNDLLRGVSGGEKKRVTIAEMLQGYGGQLYLMDSFNKGLDAAASYDICESITKVSKVFKVSFIVSLQQPSDEMFSLFDRVLVLDQGKCIYFGKPSDAQAYFESLGFKKPVFRSVPDFCSTVSYPKAFDALVDPAHIDTAPRTVEDFRQRYEASEHYKACVQEIKGGVVGSSKHITSNMNEKIPDDVYTWLERDCLNPAPKQAQLLFRRALNLELTDTQTLISGLVANVAIGLILGTLFLSLPLTYGGAYSRGGLIFLCLIFTSLSSIGTIGKKYSQKAVFRKQRTAGFYTPGPFVLASTMIDAAVIFLKILLFSSCMYWLSGLNRSGGRYGIFLLVLWISSCVIDSFIRLLSVVMDQDACTAAAGGVIVCFIVFCGYLMPANEIKPWFIWIFYISPLHYAIEALIINEFWGLNFTCTPSELQPPDPSLASVAVCPISTGELYVVNNLDWSDGFEWVWIDIGILLAFFAFFLSVAAFIMYKTNVKEYGYRKLNDSDSPDDMEIVEKKIRQAHKAYRQISRKFTNRAENTKAKMKWLWSRDSDSSNDEPLDDEQLEQSRANESKAIHIKPAYIVWKDISYTVPISKTENKTLLSHIDGFCRPGRMIALMGSSGAGKTTLLDVLSQRKTKGQIDGTIEVNRGPQDQFFSRLSGYVEQTDIHYEKLTIRESLLFSARMRLPESMPDSVKEEMVDRTIDTLMLNELKHRLVGIPGESGLSAEARKRLTIGVELVANPSILFLDEPTSGLSSREALMVARVVRRIANLGCAVICTIHQPSVEIFSEFDELLLLQRGGETVYFGEIGPGGATLVDYFVRNNAPPPEPNQNPAEYMLLQIGAGLGRKADEQRNWHEIWKQSFEAKRNVALVNDELVDMSDAPPVVAKPEESLAAAPVDGVTSTDGISTAATQVPPAHEADMRYLVPKEIMPFEFDSKFTTSRSYQFNRVSERALLMAWRTPEYNFTRIVMSLFQSFLLGLAFLQLDNNQQGLALMPAALFMSGLSGSMQMNNVIRPLMATRAVFYREIVAGLYNEFAYHAAAALCELPFILFSSVLFMVIYYFLIGFTASRFGYFFLANLLFTLWSVFVGQTICAFAPNMTIALNVPPLINTLGNVLAGFLILRSAIPPWYIWIYWINPFQYYNSGIITNQLTDQPFYCTQSEYVQFQLPVNATDCASLNNNPYFVYQDSPTPGYCEYCPVTNGSLLLESYGVGTFSKWINIAALAGFCLFFRILTLVGLIYSKHLDR